MALNDFMAQQIMGEIDALTKGIDKQIAQVAANTQALSELDQKLIQSQQDLAITTTEAQKAHTAMLADAAIAARAEIENQTQAHIEQIKREVCAITNDEARHLREQSEKAVVAALDEIKSGVAEKIELGLKGLEKVNGTFEKQGHEFTATLGFITKEAGNAVKAYDESLRISAENHKPVGLLWTTLLSLLSGFLGVLLAVLIFSMGWLQMPERSLSEKEKKQMANGELIQKAWKKMSEEEKEKLQQLWN